MRLFAILLALLTLLLAGCGYRLQGRSDTLPGDVKTIYVELFRNNTYEPFLDNTVTNEVVERFARHKPLEITEQPARAEGILSGRIVGYSNGAISYDRDDRTAEYRSYMAVEAKLRRAETGEVLWKGRVSWAEEYLTSSDKEVQEDRERAAIRLVSKRVADELFSRLIDNF